MSGNFRSTVRSIQAYLPPKGNHFKVFGEQFENGPVLHIVAVTCWTLTILVDAQNICDQLAVFFVVPLRLRPTSIVVDGEGYKLESIQVCRGLFFILLTLLRAAACMALWHFGTNFLVFYSIDPGEIVLNVVALEVVLKLHEAFYKLGPRRLHNVTNKMNPIARSRPLARLQKIGFDLRSMVMLAALVLSVVLYTNLKIFPLRDRIKEANATMCGGRTDFVYSLDPNYFVYVSHTNPFNYTPEMVAKYPHIPAINETIYETAPVLPWKNMELTVPLAIEFMGMGPEPVLSRAGMDGAQAADAIDKDFDGQHCTRDVYDGSTPSLDRFVMEVFRSMLDLDVETSPPKTCTDIRNSGHCTFFPFVLSVCAVSCGCDDPLGSVGLSAPGDGCPTSCQSTAKRTETLYNTPCISRSTAALQADPGWLTMAGTFDNKIGQIMGIKYEPQRQQLCSHGGGDCTKTFVDLGCGIVAYWAKEMTIMTGKPFDICGGDFMGGMMQARPLAAWCPIECGCHLDVDKTVPELISRACPGTCSQDHPSYIAYLGT